MGYTMLSKAVAEFLGTFVLMGAFTNVTVNGNALGALAVATSLMIGIYALGSVSGANFNPAVSISLALMKCLGWGDFSIGQLLVYIPSQLLGAFCGALFNTMLWIPHTGAWPSSTVGNSTQVLAGNTTHPWANHVIRDQYDAHGPISVLGSETLYTGLLVFVILNVATCNDTGKTKNWYFGLAIGFVIVAAACAVGGISMCCLNPAVSFGASMMNFMWGKMDKGFHALGYWLIYSLFEIIGAMIACGLFYACRCHQIRAPKDRLIDEEAPEPSLASKLLSEFLGTFVLCVTVLLVVNAAASPIAAVGIAASLMVMIYALGAVSGANFNPAVSVGLFIAQELGLVECLTYIIAQVLGAFAAFGTACFLLWGDLKTALFVKNGTGLVNGAAGGDLFAIICAEFGFTFLLVFTVLNVATGNDAGNQYYGLAIGFVIVVGAASVGSISGGCFNPAVALAIDISGVVAKGGSQYGWGYIYFLVELAAGAVAALLFKAVRCEDGEDGEDDDAETYGAVDGE